MSPPEHRSPEPPEHRARQHEHAQDERPRPPRPPEPPRAPEPPRRDGRHDPAARKPPTGISEPRGPDPGAIGEGRDPHHVLNNPASEPDPTEWPDPFDRRPDPRDPERAAPGDDDSHTPTGATSTSEPHPDEDPSESAVREARKRDRLDR